jgi:hypothetical protein
MPSAGPVVIRLPAGPNADPFRASLKGHFGFSVQNYGGAVAVDLAEGSGALTNYVTATRLCGAGEPISDATWDPLRAVDPHNDDRQAGQPLWDWANDYLNETQPHDKDVSGGRCACCAHARSF